jgi:hypothetical protein
MNVLRGVGVIILLGGGLAWVPFVCAQADGLDAATAVEKKEVVVEKPKDIFDLTIPSSWGTIKELYKGTSEQVVVHIQDAHCNYECQKNIGNILDLLVSEYGVVVAGVEGSVGKLPTELYSTFPEDTVREQASDYFIRQGVFSGPEALAISKGFEYPIELYGIEDKALYDKNFEAFQTSFPFKDEAKSYFSRLSQSLGQLKSHLYSPGLSKIDEQQLAFALTIISLNDYCVFLEQSLNDQQKMAQDFPNVSKLLKAIAIEKKLDFGRAEEERTKLLTELTNAAAEEDIKKLLDKGLAYKNGQLSAARYLAFVKELAEKNTLDTTQYKNLAMYIDYAQSYDEINSFELYNETEEADAAIRARLYTNDDQKVLDMLVRGLKVMERLVDIKMVNKDLAFFQEHKDQLKSDQYLVFINSQADKFGISLDLPTDISYLDVYMPAWVDFYKQAGMRDDAMIKNTLVLLKNMRQKAGVMVTGGFHTRELTRMMREQGISFVVITPRITQNIAGPYFNRLTGKKTMYDVFMESANAVVPVQNAAQ